MRLYLFVNLFNFDQRQILHNSVVAF